MSKVGITAEARPLQWEALPYDYGVIRRDGDSWAWTGDPITGHFPSAQRTCGSPIQHDLVVGGIGVGERASYFGNPMAVPLGCSYFPDCTMHGAN